jgi:DNA-binding NarL/FixJ family response regulator
LCCYCKQHSMNPISLLIADDHKLVREAWTLLLSKDERFTVLAESGTAVSAIEAVRNFKPDIVLLNVNLPGINDIEAVPIIHRSSPASKIIVISQHTSFGYARKMMQQGARGFVMKKASKKEFIEAIVAVHSGKIFICSLVKEMIAEQFTTEDHSRKLHKLSARELEIIELIKKGLSSKEIAETLFISDKTVEAHRHNILKKLNLKNSASLINFITKS